MKQDLTQFAHLGRPIDPRYPTNFVISRWSIIIFPIIFIFALLSGDTLIHAGFRAIVASLSIFFVWAFSREIDPQEQLSAFVSVVFMTIALFFINAQFNLLVLFYTMMMLRLVNRTVGLPAKLSNSVGLLILTAFIALIGNWTYAVIALIAFLLDSLLPQANIRHRWFAVLALVILVIAFVMQSAQIEFLLPTMAYLGAIILAGLIFIPLILKSRILPVEGDVTDESLIPIRVQSGQVFILVSAYLLALWQGDASIIEFLPLWLCIAGVSIFPVIKPFLPDWSLDKRTRKSST